MKSLKYAFIYWKSSKYAYKCIYYKTEKKKKIIFCELIGEKINEFITINESTKTS